MTTLTDRYVYAVVRSIPEKQRADIERELRASIADSIDGRMDAGVLSADAERAVLLELGDPDRLAAGYSDRPTFLIGPKYYFDYLRLLKVLYAIVLPITVVAVVLARMIAGDGIGETIGGTVTTAIMIAVHLGFWTTLVFAILERSSTAAKEVDIPGFTVESLPQIPDKRSGTGIAELVSSGVFLLFFAGLIVWQNFSSVFTDASGDPIPLLSPELWAFWIPFVLVVTGLELAFAIVLYALRRWTWPMAIVNVLLNIAIVVPAVWLITNGGVLNPAFLERLDWANDIPSGVITPVLILVFVGAAVADTVDGIVKARRASRL